MSLLTWILPTPPQNARLYVAEITVPATTEISKKVIAHAKHTRFARHKGAEGCQSQRASPQSIPLCRTKSRITTTSSPPSSAATQFVWKVHKTHNRKKSMLRVWQGERHHE